MENRVSSLGDDLIDWEAYGECRAELGADFVRILGYFREDGAKSVQRIEEAMRAMNAVALVIPAHTLKGEARQFGAEPLADLAEVIETGARTCIEHRDAPDALIAEVVKLRSLFERSLELLERESNPLVERRGGRPPLQAAGTFGRA
jgi:HPt (histidine-containing phosphotransfer) domain-containing protein